jgi:hypothetical protein
MNRPKGIRGRKIQKTMYLLEVAESCRHKAQKAEKRIEKAIEMGADDPKHEHHKVYLDLMELTERNWKHHEDYLKSYAKETEVKMPNAQLELKKNRKKNSKK